MQKKSNTFQFVLVLLRLIRPYRSSFVFGLIALILGSAMNLALPQLAKLLIDEHFQELIGQHPILVAIGVASLFAIQNLFFYFRSYYFTSVGIQVSKDLRTKLFSSLIRRELSYHDTNDWADIRSRLINDVQLLQDAVSLRLSVFLRYSVQVFIGALMMFWISPLLALIALCAIPPMLLLAAGLGRKLKKLSKSAQESIANLSRDVDDGLGQIRLIKILGAENSMAQRFEAHNGTTVSAAMERSHFAAFFSSFVNFLSNAVLILVVLYGLFLVSSGAMSSGDLTAFMLYGAIVAVSFAFVISSYTELIQASVAGDRVLPLIDRALEGSANSLESHSAPPAAGTSQGDSIRFLDVHFSYPARPEVEVLSALSVEFPPGSSTAVVGASGGGKSTLVGLILKLYSPSSGNIEYNDKSLDLWDSETLRQRIAIVPQDAPLISASIRENLLLGVGGKSESDLLEVLQQANLTEFINGLPQGLETSLGERGVQLSGGQRQRLAIARALLHNPSTLILDEATSALDVQNEAHLLDVVSKLKQRITLIVISHRLSTLRMADRIVVMRKGQVVQQGSYEEVISQPGVFRSMLETAQLEAA